MEMMREYQASAYFVFPEEDGHDLRLQWTVAAPDGTAAMAHAKEVRAWLAARMGEDVKGVGLRLEPERRR